MKKISKWEIETTKAILDQKIDKIKYKKYRGMYLKANSKLSFLATKQKLRLKLEGKKKGKLIRATTSTKRRDRVWERERAWTRRAVRAPPQPEEPCRLSSSSSPSSEPTYSESEPKQLQSLSLSLSLSVQNRRKRRGKAIDGTFLFFTLRLSFHASGKRYILSFGPHKYSLVSNSSLFL